MSMPPRHPELGARDRAEELGYFQLSCGLCGWHGWTDTGVCEGCVFCRYCGEPFTDEVECACPPDEEDEEEGLPSPPF